MIEGKNGLCKCPFENVQKDKSKQIYDPYFRGYATQTWYVLQEELFVLQQRV